MHRLVPAQTAEQQENFPVRFSLLKQGFPTAFPARNSYPQIPAYAHCELAGLRELLKYCPALAQ